MLNRDGLMGSLDSLDCAQLLGPLNDLFGVGQLGRRNARSSRTINGWLVIAPRASPP
jgi:hypothetical protein